MRLTHQNLCYFVAFGFSKKKGPDPERQQNDGFAAFRARLNDGRSACGIPRPPFSVSEYRKNRRSSSVFSIDPPSLV